MIIPLGTDRPLRRPTLINHVLIAANVAIHLLQAVLAAGQRGAGASVFDRLVFEPGVSPWYTYVSYAFLHGDFWHILGNMVTLWVFGPNVEDRFGRLGYLALYAAGAVAAAVLHGAFQDAPMVGASGAIAAVTGAFLVLFPWTNVKAFVFFLIIGVFNIPALWFIGTRIAYDFILTGSGRSGNIATLAHLGGYGLGIGLSMALLWARVFPREPYDLFTSFRQAARRRQFKDVAAQRAARPDRAAESNRRASKADEERAEAIAAARSEVSLALADGDLARAGEAYRRLVRTHGVEPGAALLSRRSQYELANGLYQAGEHQLAATAYEVFLRGYPTDPETPVVRLMLGLILGRYLNDPVRAKAEITGAMERLPEGPQRELGRTLMAELG